MAAGRSVIRARSLAPLRSLPPLVNLPWSRCAMSCSTGSNCARAAACRAIRWNCKWKNDSANSLLNRKATHTADPGHLAIGTFRLVCKACAGIALAKAALTGENHSCTMETEVVDDVEFCFERSRDPQATPRADAGAVCRRGIERGGEGSP